MSFDKINDDARSRPSFSLTSGSTEALASWNKTMQLAKTPRQVTVGVGRAARRTLGGRTG